MAVRIKEILKNQKGSSLAFVLIIGVIIMIMVVSLLSVANGDFTFTQQTVESRQAYIDAKSVIEFGKIFINNDMKDLNNYQIEKIDKQNQLNALGVTNVANQAQKAALQNRIDVLKGLIDQKEKEYPKKIYGNKNDVTENIVTDSLIVKKNGESLTETGKSLLGVCELSPPGIGATLINYSYDIDVQNLRRELNYKFSFDVNSSVNPGVLVPIPAIPSGNWCATQIKDNGNNPVSCVITEGGGGRSGEYNSSTKTLTVSANDINLEIGKVIGNGKKFEKFDWSDNQILDIQANNIDVVAPIPTAGVTGASFIFTSIGELRFEELYEQKNGKINILDASNIVFKDDLVIDAKSYLEIKNCTNLWVDGDIKINTEDINLINKISATNIFVKGNIVISTNSRVEWNYTNFWLNGNKTTVYPNSGSSSGGSASGKSQEMYY